MNDDPAADDYPGSNDLHSSQQGSYSFSVATLLGATATPRRWLAAKP
jgi:hypothetical protein